MLSLGFAQVQHWCGLGTLHTLSPLPPFNAALLDTRKKDAMIANHFLHIWESFSSAIVWHIRASIDVKIRDAFDCGNRVTNGVQIQCSFAVRRKWL